MKTFAALYERLDSTTSTQAKVAALSDYFRDADPADAAWAAHFLCGRRLKRLVGPAELRSWLVETSELPAWLVEETYASVGDLAETVALLMEPPSTDAAHEIPLTRWIKERLEPLRGAATERRREAVTGWWRSLPYRESLLLNKLLTGGLRVGVSRSLVARALADLSGVPRETLDHRLMGPWEPDAEFFSRLTSPDEGEVEASRPYPFFLASPLHSTPEELGDPSAWQAEWKWDGIRGQLIRRAGELFLFSRGEELITDRFPELAGAAMRLPDGTVLDGEIVAWKDAAVAPFQSLQTRLGRKRLTRAVLEAAPARFMAYDLLEHGGIDLRSEPLRERRRLLDQLIDGDEAALGLSPVLAADSWESLAAERETSRARRVEGLMLKRLDSPYRCGRVRGDWWKWKVAPRTLDVVMLYAQPGHGRRASLYTDYTFGVWHDAGLVPVAKAYSGLTDAEITELDRWIKRNTVDRFGPVRAVRPEQVFELAFEGVNRSRRHRSGVALRFPRILRWRRDLAAADADTLADVEAEVDED